ncbi:VOC family protein [Frankia sp. QA3]|uniref:VOC family protein n=1 Tax=Frankia sp. QA3 TaxID=710111 RepID=UPI000269C741|nr:VOC family protein [Frankia sp. QA3]EIV94841.1 lactoylglutathione lyase family protein [Frankia sp. QA3]
MTIQTVIARQRVADLDAAVPFYEQLTGLRAARFSHAGVSLASVGPFLLFAGTDEAVRRFAAVTATLTVTELDTAVGRAVAAGATVVLPATPTPNGHRALLRHPDGGVFEYVGP